MLHIPNSVRLETGGPDALSADKTMTASVIFSDGRPFAAYANRWTVLYAN